MNGGWIACDRYSRGKSKKPEGREPNRHCLFAALELIGQLRDVVVPQGCHFYFSDLMLLISSFDGCGSSKCHHGSKSSGWSGTILPVTCGAPPRRSNHGYPCLCGGGLPAVAFSATSQTRLGSRRSSRQRAESLAWRTASFPAFRRLSSFISSIQTLCVPFSSRRCWLHRFSPRAGTPVARWPCSGFAAGESSSTGPAHAR